MCSHYLVDPVPARRVGLGAKLDSPVGKGSIAFRFVFCLSRSQSFGVTEPMAHEPIVPPANQTQHNQENRHD
jgi:hypothetical protein